jgi:hypothetical protein
MGKSFAKHELILLFDHLGLEPKKMLQYLRERGQEYSYHTVKKYYHYWTTAKMIAQSILQTPPILKKNDKTKI